MATASVTAYYNSASGYVGYVGGARTVRFKFTTGASGATSLSFATKNMDNNFADDPSTWSTAANFRFAVSTNANAYNGYYGMAGKACNVTVGTGLSGSVTQNFLPNTTYYLFIFPNSTGYYDWYINGLTGNVVTLTGTYATASTVDVSDGYFGQEMAFTINRNSTGYTHTLIVQVDDDAPLTLYSKTSDYPTLTWTPILAQYASSITDKASVPLTVTLETYNGNTKIGESDTKTVALSFRAEDVGPTASGTWYAHAPLNESLGSNVNAYINEISKSRVTFTPAGITLGTGASLAKLSVTADDVTVDADMTQSTITADTPILSGETVLHITATDSRGFQLTADVTITPDAYSPPAVTDVTYFRCDSQGAASADGTYLSLTATVRCSVVENLNNVSVNRWIRRLSGTYGNPTAMTLDSSTKQVSADGTTFTISTNTVIISSVDADVSWEVKVGVTDTVGNSSETTRQVPTRSWAMKFNSTATAVGFGKAPEHTNALEIPSGWEIYFGMKSLLDRFYPVGSIYQSTDSTNPHDFMGGTWVAIGEGKVLVGAGNGYTAGDTGGEAAHTLTKAELPAEKIDIHTEVSSTDYPVMLYNTNAASGSQWPLATYGANGVAQLKTEPLGSGTAHNNMPPYLVVYMWVRTA